MISLASFETPSESGKAKRLCVEMSVPSPAMRVPPSSRRIPNDELTKSSHTTVHCSTTLHNPPHHIHAPSHTNPHHTPLDPSPPHTPIPATHHIFPMDKYTNYNNTETANIYMYMVKRCKCYLPYVAWSCHMCPTVIQHRMESPHRAFHTSTLPETTNHTHIRTLPFHLPWPVDRGQWCNKHTPTCTGTSNTHNTMHFGARDWSVLERQSSSMKEYVYTCCLWNVSAYMYSIIDHACMPLINAQCWPAESPVICSPECPLQSCTSPFHWRPCANKSQNQPAWCAHPCLSRHCLA